MYSSQIFSNLQCCVTITTIQFQNISIILKRTFFLLEDDCFTVLWQSLWASQVVQTVVSAVYQLESVIIIYIHIYTYIPSLCSLPCPTFHSSRSSQSPGWALSLLFTSFPLVTCFTHDSVPMSMLLSQFLLASPPLSVSTSPFSISAFPFLLCKQVHQYSFPRFHIYELL